MEGSSTATVDELILTGLFHSIYQMIVTIIIIVIDFLVLHLNSVPLLPLHCFYLLYLTLALAYTSQPASYLLSVQRAQHMLEQSSPNTAQKLAQCVICHRAKPPRYYHCRHCSRCVYRLDHHCNFVGNCVGHYNFKIYVHFLVNGLIHSFIVSLIILWNWKELVQFNSYVGLYWLNILPAFFGTYENARLLKGFWLTITRNQTLIQSYKLVRGPKKTTRACFEEYFGKGTFSWFLPTFLREATCNLLEPTFPLQEQLHVKQYTYADEYIYGGDDQDEWQEPERKKD